MAVYRNCKIFRTIYSGDHYVWEELSFGAESDLAFPTIEAAKADIDAYFLPGPAVVEGADNEMQFPA